jgi:transcriptional regulator with XRE-family HTH domain
MSTPHQRLAPQIARRLRWEAGRWLRELREERGLSQRELAHKVGVEYYTLIAQLEHGRGRIPSDQYLIWADALGVDRREFVRPSMNLISSPLAVPATPQRSRRRQKSRGELSIEVRGLKLEIANLESVIAELRASVAALCAGLQRQTQ